jgi:hypothetical protein
VPAGVAVTLGCVIGTLCAIVLPPPQPIAANIAIITASPANAPPQISRQLRAVLCVLRTLHIIKNIAKSTRAVAKGNSVCGLEREVSENGISVPAPVVATVTLKGTPTPLVTFIAAGTVHIAAVIL